MTKWLTVLLLLVSCSASQAALQTNFSGCYCTYLHCVSLQGASKCYKLYFDPAGIVNGQVTAFVDVPDPGVPRLDTVAEVMSESASYTATLGSTTFAAPPGHQRVESRVSFSAINPLNPPQDKVTIFSYDLGDKLALGTAGSTAGFIFQPGDFIDTYDPSTNDFRHYDYNAIDALGNRILQDQIFDASSIQTPEPGACALAVAGMMALAGWRRKHRG
jgi:hypothetical protein